MIFVLGLLGFVPDTIVVSPYLQNNPILHRGGVGDQRREHRMRCGIRHHRESRSVRKRHIPDHG